MEVQRILDEKSWHAIILVSWQPENIARSPAVEDYCKAIFTLESRAEEPVATNPLAERLGITPGSVSAMLKRLGELGLIEHHPYRGVRLTARRAQGRARGDPPPPPARAVPRRGAGDALGSRARRGRGARARDLRGARAADRRQARRPDADPHGDPIPSAELELHEPETHAAGAPRRGRRRRVRARVRRRPRDAQLPLRARHLSGRSPARARAPAVRRPAARALRRRRLASMRSAGGSPRAMRVQLDRESARGARARRERITAGVRGRASRRAARTEVSA